MTPGRKYDSGKAEVAQGVLFYFPDALKAVAGVSKYGKDKYDTEYSDTNWALVDNKLSRYTEALTRHILEDSLEGVLDPESKHLHAAHAAWNALVRLQIIMENASELNSI